MTARISTDGPHRVAVGHRHPLSSLVEIDVDARSHPGYHRANNEDHFFVTRLGRTLQTITSLPAEDVPALTAVRSFGRDLLITHVGNSRAYLLRAGSLHRLTRDHTFAQLLVDSGHLAPGDVAVSRHRHVLTNALGGGIEDVQVDTDQLQLEDGDRLLLCSDGLTDLVDDETITNILRETTRSSDACERLVQRALDNGGRDNVTVIVAAYRLPEEAGRSKESTGDEPDGATGI